MIKMDSSAVIYPMSITFTTQSLFRLSVEMADLVDFVCLQTALKENFFNFPTFKTRLRSGFFKYFLDENDLEPLLHKDSGILFEKINFKLNNGYLVRISYFENRISADFFHGLCDGIGALSFFKSLICRYLFLKGDIEKDDENLVLFQQVDLEKSSEDAFLKYRKPFKLSADLVEKIAGKTAFQVKSNSLKGVGYGMLEGRISVEDFKKIAKKFDCSITVLIAANALLSIYEANKTSKDKAPLSIAVPVDLRRLFPSETLLNFTSIVRLIIDQNVVPPTLQAYAEEAKRQLKEKINSKDLEILLSASCTMNVNPFLKILPAFLKTAFAKLGKLLSFKTKQTIIFSNLGVVNVPKSMENFIKSMVFNLNVSKKVPINMTALTINGTVNVAFTRRIISTEIEKIFFKRLAKEGAKVEIVSNLREEF